MESICRLVIVLQSVVYKIYYLILGTLLSSFVEQEESPLALTKIALSLEYESESKVSISSSSSLLYISSPPTLSSLPVNLSPITNKILTGCDT